jgi:hypothetical protein
VAAAARLPIVAALAALLSATDAVAHDRSRSFSSWDLTPDGARVRLSMSALDLSRLSPEVLGRADGVGAYVIERLRLSVGGTACVATAPTRLAAAPGSAVYEWSVRCQTGHEREGEEEEEKAREETEKKKSENERKKKGSVWEIRSTLLSEVAPSHLHFVRLRLRDGSALEKVLSSSGAGSRIDPERLRSADGAEDVGGGTSIGGYVRLGVHHVATGWDHVAFLLALLLLAANLGELVGVATAFTAAHSLTLGLATLGAVRLDAAVVEALVGFSIALVAAENAWSLAGKGSAIPRAVALALSMLALLGARGIGSLPATTLLGLALFSACHFGLLRRARRSLRLRALVAFAFGLVHGCAFATVLGELELPRARIASALFGFNAGVEIGQLWVILTVWPLLQVLGRYSGGRSQRLAMEAGSAALCGLGVFWFLARAFG